jgi:uncharacterized membrane protein YphA (DoxX/SURF4 family)
MPVQEELEDQVQTRLASGAEEAPSGSWTVWTRIAFRFACLYLGLYDFTAILGWVPYSDVAFHAIKSFQHQAVPWVGKHILHLSHDITVFSNGSGDTTFDYIYALCLLALAGVGTIIWSLLDRKRLQYNRLHQWLRLYVRIALASAFIGYGMSKLQQFPVPILSTLMEPYGQSSPMTLLWTFMGASRPYCLFAGFAETLAGILLLFPGLTILGALIGTAVMTNVFMLNMCYDVCVKLYSFHLLLMCVFLLLPETPRLANFFLFNRAIAPARPIELFNSKALNKTMAALQVLFCCYLLYLPVTWAMKQSNKQSYPLFGTDIWTVDEFAVDNQIRRPLLTDNDRWQRISFPYKEMLSVQYTNGKTLNYGIKVKGQQLEVLARSEQTSSDGDQVPTNVKEHTLGLMTFTRPDTEHLVFTGTMEGKRILASLHRLHGEQFLLLNRGFHWIQEYPFDR